MSAFNVGELFKVQGLVALITGGGSGIGLMMTKALALNGAHKVYIVGRRKEALEAAAKESPHGNIIPIAGDVSSKQDLQAVADQVKSEVGYLNLLIANSGIGGPQTKLLKDIKSIDELQSEIWNLDSQSFTNTFNVNVTAAFFTIAAFLNLLDAGNKKGNVEQKSQIITTSSIGGFNRQPPGGFAYGLSKAAATHLAKQLASVLIPYDIRSNVLTPGLYPSDLAAGLIGEGPIPREKVPLQRVGTDEDMAGAILYLTSRAGAYCNGNVVVTDGGRLAQVPSVY
ncbi:uncharacterized protein KY384_004951 [Bacidia gigantensis]|uniref:uncharacterized protein n=1 Tax=Bacidia gigantensis TaxID=2732470 RepID=UPI001D036793|nr:uncharacterized protein KY384_004951 [Bacidia gigantensis]KAG8530449.1 hypothetical protein KY384_004951 [Bacidia gigantensis]